MEAQARAGALCPLPFDAAQRAGEWAHGSMVGRPPALPCAFGTWPSGCGRRGKQKQAIGFPVPTLYLGEQHSAPIPSHTPWVLAPAPPAKMKRERQWCQCRVTSFECRVGDRFGIRTSTFASDQSGAVPATVSWTGTRRADVRFHCFGRVAPCGRRSGLGRSRAERPSRCRRPDRRPPSDEPGDLPACVTGTPTAVAGPLTANNLRDLRLVACSPPDGPRGTGVPPGALVPPWPDCSAAARAS